ncbi:uncharacterized protein LOC135394583 isoform X2 [Ornithodoros turicata]
MCDDDNLWAQAKFVMFPDDETFESLFDVYTSRCQKDLGPIDPDWFTREADSASPHHSGATRSVLPTAAESPCLMVREPTSQESNRSAPNHEKDGADTSESFCISTLWSPLSCTRRNECDENTFRTPILPCKDFLRQSLGAQESGSSVKWSPSLETPPCIPSATGKKVGSRQIAPKTLFQGSEKGSSPDSSTLEEEFSEFPLDTELEERPICSQDYIIEQADHIEQGPEHQNEEVGSNGATALDVEASRITNEGTSVSAQDVKDESQRNVNESAHIPNKTALCTGKPERTPWPAFLTQDSPYQCQDTASRSGAASCATPSSKPNMTLQRRNLQHKFCDMPPKNSAEETGENRVVENIIEDEEDKMDTSFVKSQIGYSLTQILEAAESTAACMEAPDILFTQTESFQNFSSEDYLMHVALEQTPKELSDGASLKQGIRSIAPSSPGVSKPLSEERAHATRICTSNVTNFALCAGKCNAISPVRRRTLKRPLSPALEENQRHSMPEQHVTTGFTTCAGKPVYVTSKCLTAAESLMAGIGDDLGEHAVRDVGLVPVSRSVDEQRIGNASPVPSGRYVCTGFSTGRGRSIKVSAAAMSSAKELLSESIEARDVNDASCKIKTGRKNFKFENMHGSKPLSEEVTNGAEFESKTSLPVSAKDRTSRTCNECGTATPHSVSVESAIVKKDEALLDSKWFTAGFTTASGKSVRISEASLKAARSSLCDAAVDDNPECKPAGIKTSFMTSTGQVVSVSADSLGIASSLLQDSNSFQVTEKQNHDHLLSDKVTTGFTTGSGKKVEISRGSLKAAAEVLSDTVRNTCTDVDGSSTAGRTLRSTGARRNDAIMTGFSTGSGKAVTVSRQAMSDARARLNDAADGKVGCPPESVGLADRMPSNGQEGQATAAVDEHETMTTCSVNSEGVNAKKDGVLRYQRSLTAGFTTASGKSVTISESSLKAAQSFLCDAAVDDRPGCKLASVKTSLTTVTGKAVSSGSLDVTKSLMTEKENCDDLPHDKVTTGFTTGNGKKVEISRDSLKTVAAVLSASVGNMWTDVDRSSTAGSTARVTEARGDDAITTGFSAGSGKAVTVSRKAISAVQARLSDAAVCNDSRVSGQYEAVGPLDDVYLNGQEEGTTVRVSTGRFGESVSVSARSLNGAREMLCEDSLLDQESSTVVNPHQLGAEMTSEASPLAQGTCSRNAEEPITPKPAQPQPSTQHMWTPPLQRMFSTKLKTPTTARTFVTPFKVVGRTSGPAEATLVNNPEKTCCTRKNAIQPGKLWILRRLQKQRRIPMRVASGGSSPRLYTLDELERYGVSKQTALITCRNAECHRFYLGSTEELTVLGDGIILNPCKDLKLGKNEFYEAFVGMPGVDASLICQKWFANHYKWIVWKLAAMEQHFPQVFGGRALTPDQVMTQMKYRYDIEIDNSSRSALRKILERDDVPSKTMVLCVSDIKQEDNAVSLEVTDGWYSIPTVIDEPLSKLVADSRILRGQKLVISCAELIGTSSACAPLEVAEGTALKISFNTTRRARWDTRLGYFGRPQPFPVPLLSLHPRGGPAGRVDCIVIRTYPLMYLEKLPNGTSIMRNERAERLVAAAHDRVRAEHMERLMADVLSQVEKSNGDGAMLQGVKTVHVTYSKKQIRGLTSGQDIWKALQCCADTSEIEGLLTEEQVKLLREYQEQCLNQKQAVLQEKLQRALETAEDEERCPPKRTVTPVLKVLVGGLHEKDLQRNVCCIASVWRPCSELQQTLVEGNAVTFYNVGVCPVRNILPDVHYSAVELTTSKATKYQAIKCPEHVKIYYERQVTSFALLRNQHDSQSRGVDIVGLVFHIKHQKDVDIIYLSDASFNFVQLTVYGGCDVFLAEGKLKEGQIISATDLIVRPKRKDSEDIISLATTELSEIACAPRRPHLQDAIAAFQDRVLDFDLLASSALQKFREPQPQQQHSMNLGTPKLRPNYSAPISRVYASGSSNQTPPTVSNGKLCRPNVATTGLPQTRCSDSSPGVVVTSNNPRTPYTVKPATKVLRSTPVPARNSTQCPAAMYDGLILSGACDIEPGSPADVKSKRIRAKIALLERYGALAPLPALNTPTTVVVKRPYRTPVLQNASSNPLDSPPMELDVD